MFVQHWVCASAFQNFVVPLKKKRSKKNWVTKKMTNFSQLYRRQNFLQNMPRSYAPIYVYVCYVLSNSCMLCTAVTIKRFLNTRTTLGGYKNILFHSVVVFRQIQLRVVVSLLLLEFFPPLLPKQEVIFVMFVRGIFSCSAKGIVAA